MEEDGGHQNIEDLEDEADCSQDNPGPHEADVPLKYKYKVIQGGRSFRDSAVMKLGFTFDHLDQF